MTNRKEALKRAFLALDSSTTALKNLKPGLKKDLDGALSILEGRSGKIISTGVGKSSFIAMKFAATLVSLGHKAQFLHPVEALHGDSGVVSDGDVIVAFSFSGESKEVVNIISYFKKVFKIKVVSITGSKDSSLARLSNALVRIKVESEGSPLGLAPMASTTAFLAVADAISAALTTPAEFEEFHFAKFHPGGSLGLKLTKVKDIMTSGDNIPLVVIGTPLSEALRVISKKKFGSAGVVDKKGKLVGVITDGDLRRFLLKHSSVEGVEVEEMMTKNPKTIDSEDSLELALKKMEAHKITNLFALSRNRPFGIIHMHDIIGGNFL